MKARIVPSVDLESSIQLITKARVGDTAAAELLLKRYLPRFMAWAKGRLPSNLRGPKDTGDVVQEVIISFTRNLPTFLPAHTQAPMSYLRRAFLNRVKDLHRQQKRRGTHIPIEDADVTHLACQYDQEIASDVRANYERALEKLTPEQREAVVMRVEFQLTYEQIALDLGSPTVAAARMLVHRGLSRLTIEMARD